jgi:hypothetical protein
MPRKEIAALASWASASPVRSRPPPMARPPLPRQRRPRRPPDVLRPTTRRARCLPPAGRRARLVS